MEPKEDNKFKAAFFAYLESLDERYHLAPADTESRAEWRELEWQELQEAIVGTCVPAVVRANRR